MSTRDVNWARRFEPSVTRLEKSPSWAPFWGYRLSSSRSMWLARSGSSLIKNKKNKNTTKKKKKKKGASCYLILISQAAFLKAGKKRGENRVGPAQLAKARVESSGRALFFWLSFCSAWTRKKHIWFYSNLEFRLLNWLDSTRWHL